MTRGSITLAKQGEGCVNEDAVMSMEGVIAVSDGAGGGGLLGLPPGPRGGCRPVAAVPAGRGGTADLVFPDGLDPGGPVGAV